MLQLAGDDAGGGGSAPSAPPSHNVAQFKALNLTGVIWTVRFWSTVDATPEPTKLFVFFFFLERPKLPRKRLPSTLCKYTTEEPCGHFSHFCRHALCLEKKSVLVLTFSKMLKVFLFAACVASVAAQVFGAWTPRFCGCWRADLHQFVGVIVLD